MQCKECNLNKDSSEFYYIDGGLGYNNSHMNICKNCVTDFNVSRQRNKYYDEQITALYYGAKAVINGQLISNISREIDNGITTKSNRMAIQNFLYLFNVEGGGLSSASRQMKKIFNYYENDRVIYPNEIQDENNFIEGSKKLIIVNAYERNSKARKECIEHYKAKCFICEFDFEKNYGKLGKGFIQVHHLKPLSEIDKEYIVDPIRDLIPICPNCHSMIHKRIPAYTIEEIKSIYQTNKSTQETSQ